jgi:hypothetical protein
MPRGTCVAAAITVALVVVELDAWASSGQAYFEVRVNNAVVASLGNGPTFTPTHVSADLGPYVKAPFSALDIEIDNVIFEPKQ